MVTNPGPEGTPLPRGAEIFRLFRATNDGQCPPEAFHLSSEDKTQAVPRLSVWETTNTTCAEADGLTSQRYGMAAFLLVDEVRQLRPEPDHPGVLNLDVEWEAATELVGGVRMRVDKPGASGHCGITRLNQERSADGNSLKSFRKSLYARLARLANGRRVERLR